MLKKIIRRARLEARALPTRIRDCMLAALPEEFKYERGMISMEASIRNLRRNGFEPGGIIDIGAFQGDWSRMVRRIYPAAPICMLDANPEKAPLLAAAARELGNVQHRICLLGPQSTPAVNFHVRGTGSSVLQENTATPFSTLELPMDTLDHVLQATQLPSPYLLKLDVQGFELEVLSGAEETLRRAEAVLLEVSLLEYNLGAPLLADVVAFMKSRNLVTYDIAGFYRRETDGALYMADLLFVPTNSPLRAKKRFWNWEAQFETASVGESTTVSN